MARWKMNSLLVRSLGIALLLAGSALGSSRLCASTPEEYPSEAPGVVREGSEGLACSTAWGRDARQVTQAMKRAVFARDHLTPEDCTTAGARRCEVDHRVPRELLGADDVHNLWIMSYGGKWNASMKDKLENLIHKKVCAGEMSLAEGQQIFLAPDWHISYITYYGDPYAPSTAPRRRADRRGAQGAGGARGGNLGGAEQAGRAPQ